MAFKYNNLLRYIIKCLIGTAIGFYLYRLFPTLGAWCLISIILVLAPDEKDAMNLATNRIIANLIGAAIGLTLFYIHPINLFMICLGITIAIVACELLKLQTATRSAGVALLIITMHQPGQYFWDVALERAGGVLCGCIIGMIITYVFHISLLRSKMTNK
ncbi:FUSC family protein [Mucilaginibacter jinjuensis]|uniref:FUSC family protein n=1 Tax=Mucilaginibacter jinjuensis TaxID=1176721 RepID=A0ABY7T9F5_9SPHI|nr:FUSC family protein [Mucilaginibacter jinjuensis]WCT13109.1 FUSC family protein [Mucilaginibacter jinjuensis]